ncbi:MAG: Uma2 family endonuclease [Saprospiraceae bacterium]|nr:Uma2 family endonuclease [Saprospiraceae bacterium]MBK8634875.1 Uma2 family endonuclease [Saprospiraceae bacterium]HMS68706.1 Uma2 family endonuclease [Saprospiraceae bacterium]
MIAHKYLPSYTYEDYLHWEGRWELIDGIPFAMSPMPSPSHQKISGNLHYTFLNVLKNKNTCNCDVYQPIDLKISEHTIVNPDLLIVCKPIQKQFLDFPPELVVEILSPSTAVKDRTTKYDLYEAFKIKYYLIIDIDKNLIQTFELSADGRYEMRPSSIYTFEFDGGCKIEVDLSSIFG